MQEYVIRECSSEESDLVLERLVEYNLSKVPATQKVNYLYLNRVVEDANGKIIAGILSKMYCWNCVHIDILWVSQEHRKHGLGTRLINEIERISMEQGCCLIHLDTFDFQAKDFYIKHGYEIFGTLEDCPKGHMRFYMKKNL